MTYIRNINHKTKRSSMVAHPSSNNKVVGSNPRSSIFLCGQVGAPQLHCFVPKSGLPRCGQLGPGADGRGWPGHVRGWPGHGRDQPLSTGSWPIVAWVWSGAGAVNRYHHLLFFTFFSIFHCIYNMAMYFFFDLFRDFSFLDFFHS
jgi:hypothetical protein